MRFQIQQLNKKAKEFNKQRTMLALGGMNNQTKTVYQLLPLLFHYHQPELPGYIAEDVPRGIDQFTPNSSQLALLFLEFNISLAGSRCDFSNIKAESKGHCSDKDIAILGIYSMGSTSSLGQGNSSDLDIWLCCKKLLSPTNCNLLEKKAVLISTWAKFKGVQLNFFMVSEDHFRKKQICSLTKERCGSALHWLLLDEFYRSALHLAGRQLLWHLIPYEYEHIYDSYIHRLIQAGIIIPSQWLDFGRLQQVPIEEYLGASLWQLYKGIDAPYKAVLKIILLESYSTNYHNTELLCLQVKRYFQQSSGYTYMQDPYYLMLGQATSYLKNSGDLVRLDLVRRCFYLKNCTRKNKVSTNNQYHWQENIMSSLLVDWGWDEQKISSINRWQKWKVKEVKAIYQELVAALLKSYRNLLTVAYSSPVTANINQEDVTILSRKLYAAFEVSSDKVTLINPNISPNLAEQNLLFVQASTKNNILDGWYLYNQPPMFNRLINHQSIEYNKHLARLVAWAYFNQIITLNTKLHLHSQSSNMLTSKLIKFVKDLRRSLPINVSPVSNTALTAPCYIQHLGIFINLKQNQYHNCQANINKPDEKLDNMFCFGKYDESLINSIDIIYRNSWNEIKVLCYQGDEAVPAMLTAILNNIYREARPPEKFNVFCYSRYFKTQIRSYIYQLTSECINHRLYTESKYTVKVLLLGKVRYGLFFGSRKVTIQKLNSKLELCYQISNNKLNALPLRLAHLDHIKVPSVVDSYASEGIVQLFFEKQNLHTNIYIVNKQNQIKIYQNYIGDKEKLIQNITQFYTYHDKSNLKNSQSKPSFNLPQFYELVNIESQIFAVPYRSHYNL